MLIALAWLDASTPGDILRTATRRLIRGPFIEWCNMIRTVAGPSRALVGRTVRRDAVRGWSLPQGVTLVEYAHRGAYPLLITALLAGAFAAAARPFIDRPGLRILVLIWLLQNLALTAGALSLLDLYVDAFGLSYLRLHAALWLGIVTLYLASFVNFGAIILRHNVTHDRVDMAHVCTLPPTAGWTDHACPDRVLRIEDWRDWSFREYRAIQRAKAGQVQRWNDKDPGGR